MMVIVTPSLIVGKAYLLIILLSACNRRDERIGWACDPAAQSCGYDLVCTRFDQWDRASYFGCTYACETDEDCNHGGECFRDTGTLRAELGIDYPTGKFCQLFDLRR